MFGRRKTQQATIHTLVGANSRVNGDVEFSGGFLVDGYIKGNVSSTDVQAATLNVSERGCVEGTVTVPNVVLNGTVKGDVKASERVELGPKARVIGNVQYKLIEMAIGAEVNGKLIHESDSNTSRQTASPAIAPVRAVNRIGE